MKIRSSLEIVLEQYVVWSGSFFVDDELEPSKELYLSVFRINRRDNMSNVKII